MMILIIYLAQNIIGIIGAPGMRDSLNVICKRHEKAPPSTLGQKLIEEAGWGPLNEACYFLALREF
jgi:hypothetical protein